MPSLENPSDVQIFQRKKVSSSEAIETCRSFWEWCNSKDGHPEHYPDEEVVRFTNVLQNAKSKKILDLASGNGKNTLALAETGAEVICIDWSENGLKYTAERLAKFNFKASFIRHDFSDGPMPIETASIDAAVAIQVFDHIFESQASILLNDLHRVLKPGGRALISLMSTDTNRPSRRGVPVENERNTELVSTGNSKGEIHRFIEVNEMREFIRSKFEIISETQISIKDLIRKNVADTVYFSVAKEL